MESYDVILLGLGTMGSAAALELTRRKARVAGFDQLRPPHGAGSHGGQTRVFRVGYAESPDYVPLVRRAGELWDRFSAEFGTKLLNRIGLLTMDLPLSEPLQGIQRCVDLKQLEIERLSAGEIRHRYPAFHVPDEFIGLLETGAGWLDVDAAISGMQKSACEGGAHLYLDEEVTGWENKDGVITVHTAKRRVRARQLIVTAGAWTTNILRSVGLPIRIVRKTFLWFDPLKREEFAEAAIPIFGFPTNAFYGFPNIRGEGVKVAEHLGGDEIGRPEEAKPANEFDYACILKTASRFLPGLAGSVGDPARILKSSVCLYSITPDQHFILDVHPEQSNVFLAAGFSGHGFKFAPVIGEVMADLALNGVTKLPIDFLRWKEERRDKWKPQTATLAPSS